MENPNNYLLTTIDNPYNPFNDWDSWYAFDELHGYHTCRLIDRFYKTSELIPDWLDEFCYNDAMERIMDLIPYYIVVDRETEVKPVSIDKMEQILGLNVDGDPVEVDSNPGRGS